MPGERRTPHCSGCHRPCRGHQGPTGKKCPVLLRAREKAARERQMAAINMTTPPQASARVPDFSTLEGGTSPAFAATNVSALDCSLGTVNLVPIHIPNIEPHLRTSPNVQVTQGGEQIVDESITNYVNNLIPGNGVPTSPINTPGSTTPPVTTTPLLSAHEVQSINSPISTAPPLGVTSAAPSVHLAQSVATHYVYQAPITTGVPVATVSSGVPAVPMYSGHPIPSPLWQGHTGSYVYPSAGQPVPIAGQTVSAPAPYRPPGGSYVHQGVGPLGGSTVPSIPYSAAVQFAPSVPATTAGVGYPNLVPVGVHSIGAAASVGVTHQGIVAQPTYSYAPASGNPFWGGAAQPAPTAPPVAPPTVSPHAEISQRSVPTNSIHPSAPPPGHSSTYGYWSRIPGPTFDRLSSPG